MKYVLLIYQPSPFDPKALSEEEYRRVAAGYAAVTREANVTPGLPLGLPKDAVTVRVADGQTQLNDAPYVSEAGAVGGYMIVETESKEEAIALAARIPAAQMGGAVEVRPAQPYW